MLPRPTYEQTGIKIIAGTHFPSGEKKKKKNSTVTVTVCVCASCTHLFDRKTGDFFKSPGCFVTILNLIISLLSRELVQQWTLLWCG